jgi:hypothetical protein
MKSSLAPFAVALALLSGIACAADEVALTCSGTRVAAGTKEPAPNQSLVIDLDRGIVKMGSVGKLSVVKLTETSVQFKGNSEDGQTVWQGDVDRFSGVAVVSAWRDERIVMHYQLICRRPEPLF